VASGGAVSIGAATVGKMRGRAGSAEANEWPEWAARAGVHENGDVVARAGGCSRGVRRRGAAAAGAHS